MYCATSCTLWLMFALLSCLSSGSPVPTHLLLPRGIGKQISQTDTVEPGTTVWVPLKGVEGPRVNEKVPNKNSHLAIILEPPVNGIYPIAYISHDAAYTVDQPMQIQGLSAAGKLKHGGKQSALQVNMYEATGIERKLSQEELKKLKKIRDGAASRSPSPQPEGSTRSRSPSPQLEGSTKAATKPLAATKKL
ncbi:hypothetical protein C8J56DRAFT_1161678 [Mycena floridula]|nr:hypothetical protein C8J56DRAFT_1161678 [Mycena floridula]